MNVICSCIQPSKTKQARTIIQTITDEINMFILMIDVHQVVIWSVAKLLPVSRTHRPGPRLGLEPGGLHLATLVSWMFLSLRFSWAGG